MRPSIAGIFLLAWALLAILSQPGFYIDDEIGQAASVVSKAGGHPGVSGDIPAVYHTIGLGDTRGGLVPPPGAEMTDSGSWLLSALSLPAWALLSASILLIGTAATGALAATLPAAVAIHAWRPGTGPWQRRPVTIALALVAFNALLAAIGPQPPRHAYLEVLAIQSTLSLFIALGAALLWDLAARRWGATAGWVVLAAVLGSPLLFWALNIKYHGLALAFLMVAIWCYQDGHRSSPLRTGLAFASAGLAISTHTPNGFLMFASMGMVAAPAVVLGVKPLLARAGAGVAGLGLGLVPDVLEGMALKGIELRERHYGLVTAANDDAVAATVESRFAQAIWNEPIAVFEAARDALFYVPFTHVEASEAVPILVGVPFALAAMWRLRRAWPSPLTAWALVHLVLLFALFGQRVFANGGGFDLRQASTALPFLVLLAAPGLAAAWDAHGPRWFAAGAGLLVVVGAIQLFLRRLWPGIAFDWVHIYSLKMQMLAVGYTLLASMLVLAVHERSVKGPWMQRMWLAGLGAGVAWQLVLQFTLARTAPDHDVAALYGFVPFRLVEAVLEWFFVSW